MFSQILHCTFVVYLVLLIENVFSFPSDIPRCRAGDTNCVTKTAMVLIRRYAKTGYSEMGFPRLEPFLLERFDITDGHGTAVNLKLNFQDLLVGGLSDVLIERSVGFTADPTTSKFEMYGTFGKLTLRGKYQASGRILILPIQGDGDADISLIKPRFSVKFKPIVNVSNGKSYLEVGKLKVLMQPEKITVKLTNLFNGDKHLGDNLNQFLNNNWSDVWTELQPSIHTAISEIIKRVATNIFKKFSYEELYLK